MEPARETQGLYNWIKETVTSIPSRAAKITNLPIPRSSFVGRERELSEIKQMLSKLRLVTLTGAGGSGKTRLAIHAATDLIDSYRDGVWWVELAPLSDASLVPHAVARALGMEVEIRPIENPRTELEEHYYNPDHEHLLKLGYEPTHDMEHEITTMLEDLRPHAARIEARREAQFPDIRWDGSRRPSHYLDER